MKPLDPISLPLNKICLIEASAGTGKTYTMANLYLRLLLGVGCAPLTVEQILVVTFTKAATQELKDRIRSRIAELAQAFKQHRAALQAGENSQIFAKEPFWQQLYEAVETDLDRALLRLQIAEQDIDLASIFTIHSFCQKMLLQFAFDSGMRFDLELQADQSELLQRLSEEVWREQFYPMSLAETELVAAELGTPAYALGEVRRFLLQPLPELSAEQRALFQQDFADYARERAEFFAQAKQHWRENGAEMAEIIRAELAKTYKKSEKKALNRRSYQERYLVSWIAQMDEWAQSAQTALPKHFERFCEDFLASSAEENATPLSHAHFAKNQYIQTACQQRFSQTRAMLLYRFLTALRAKLVDYQRTHKERGFDDILTMLNHALQAEQGKTLASHIRHQFPFAMIDEFQDTDRQQYDIFRQIFMAEGLQDQGFIMIGDPKQSIYKFRGADIFTYLEAAKRAEESATLNRNWRSVPNLIGNVNRLFDFANAPFLYQDIQFHSVLENDSTGEFFGEPNCRYFLQIQYDETLAAQHAAYLIQQQLKNAEAGQLYLQKNGEKQPLVAEQIAVLVRTKNQAKLMKQALAACHIQAVILSEDRSVYQSEEAKELLLLLRACLTPYDQRALLATLGSSLWQLTATEIYQLRHDEHLWDQQVSDFVNYQQRWQQQGILPMLHHIFIQQKMLARIQASGDADRRITNLLHLAELLQSAMPSLENETALVRWFERQLQNPAEGQDDQTLRLESEAKLVKIVTIHGSKGLQYPVVWLPFIGKGKKGVSSQQMVIYRDEQQQAHWSFGQQDDEVKALIEREEFAEDLRLLYVALTRAEYQLNSLLPAQFSGSWNAMWYLLSNGELEKSDTESLLKAKQNAEIATLEDVVPVDDWSPKVAEKEALHAAVFHGKIRYDGQITSFSALHAMHERNHLANGGQDYDWFAPATELTWAEDVSQEHTAYQFPHSMKVGTVLHTFFEHCDFSQPISPEAVQQLCEQVGLDESWFAPTQRWLEHILATPFGTPAFALNQIRNEVRLNEWQFYLRLSNSNALPKLNQLLKRYSPLAKNLPDLQLFQLEGFVRGFVDCIVQVNGQFYVLDYKSNFLGYFAQDYAPQNIAKAMGQYRYDLQYLLYTLAVHRYLRSRLGEDYDYARDFGGVAYLFLRGMQGTENSGVYFDKPEPALIEEMDQLFG